MDNMSEEKDVLLKNRKIKIDIVVPPYSGHLNPILDLIKPIMNDKNYDICIYTGYQKQDLVKSLGLKSKTILKNKPTILEDIANTPKKTNAIVSFNQFKQNIKLVPEIIKELEEGFADRKPDIVIADFVAVPAGIVSNRMGIPWISSMPTPFAIESKTTTPTYMGGWYPREGVFYKVRDSFGRFVIRRFKKIVLYLVKKYNKGLNYKLYNEKKEENAYSPYSILALGMKELEFRDDFPERVIWTGPCLSSFAENVDIFTKNLSFKNKVFLTIGTHLLWGKDKLIEIAKDLSLEFEDTVFIVSLGNISQKDDPVDKVLDNMYVYKYIDYGEILPVVDYVIHHGGAGILYNCIKYNKPAVIVPHDYDQFDFSVRADIAGIGIPAKLKSKASIKKAVRQMLEKENWDKLNVLNKKLFEYNPNEILKSEINRLLKNKNKTV